MNYQQLISRVSDEVRDRAWPEPDGSVTQEQIDISYAAVLAKAISLPIFELDRTQGTLQGSSATSYSGYLKHDLPDDIFLGRDDLGVFQHEFDSVQYDPNQAVPLNTLRMLASNSLYSDNDGLFSYDRNSRSLFIVTSDTAKDVTLDYVPEPTKPDTNNYDSTDVPLPESELQPTVHMIANHIAGSRMRDSAGAQFQAILGRMYDTKAKPQAVSE